MSKLDSLPDRTLELATNLAESLKHLVPDSADNWLRTGVRLTALKTGARAASFFVRRNPAVAVAAAAGAGLLWYAARHHARKAENAPIEGSSKRVEAKRSTGSARKSTARKRRTTKTPSSD